MKDECAGTPIAERVFLRRKRYSIVKADKKNIKKGKGVKKKRCEETNNARSVQGCAFRREAAVGRDEHPSKRWS